MRPDTCAEEYDAVVATCAVRSIPRPHERPPRPLFRQMAGAPDQTAFGMTVTDETQTVWLGAPGGPSWMLPA